MLIQTNEITYLSTCRQNVVKREEELELTYNITVGILRFQSHLETFYLCTFFVLVIKFKEDLEEMGSYKKFF